MSYDSFKSSDGVPLCYRQQGNGPLIVGLHGFPDTYQTWDDLGAGLAHQGYSFIGLAMRGYAPSGIPENGNYAIHRLARDVVELLDHIGCQSAIVVGHDWGASAAYALAARYPDRVTAIVAFAIAPPAVAPGGFGELRARPHNLYLSLGALSNWWFRRRNFREIERLYRLWSPSWQVPRSHLDRVRDALKAKERSRAAIDYYRLGRAAQSSDALMVKLSTRCLVLYGEDEPDVRKSAFRKALSVLGGESKIVEIAGVGHWPHLEAPDLCLSKAKEFLMTTSGAAQRQS
ncbi:alpha/beta fold hydrolase [Breoghania corrubedonensis]|uniref:alpha/beta fold hydrolase n=1 Tax=Breoghania corrubedonensis TaxID=665038 RepID=UPI001474375E|nr:alpha/beta hydrolase [Breoghania corrubedonensis]